jgi:hypothetical protein
MSFRQVDGSGDALKPKLLIILQLLVHDLVTVLLSMETESSCLVGLQMIAKILKITSPGILMTFTYSTSLLLDKKNFGSCLSLLVSPLPHGNLTLLSRLIAMGQVLS